jgi:flotillin
VVGYKVVRRGWAVKIPMLQTISRMDMRLFMVEVSVANAYSKGGIPLAVNAITPTMPSTMPAR